MITFEDLGLRTEIVSAVTDLGFEKPTPIQEKAVPHILSSQNDLLAFAQTGTGKTAAFSLPVISQLDVDDRSTQALILCPTRELCLQISNDIAAFIKYLRKVKVISVYGGEKIDRQLRALRDGGQIVVGTPGRTRDLINRGKLNLSTVKWLVLDEADEMLTMGFKDDLDAILSKTPESKQTLLFSATRQKGIEEMVRTFMTTPEEISIGRKNIGADNLDHAYYMVRGRDKYQALKRILDLANNIYGIIFCRTRRETQEISDKLSEDNYNAEPIHGDLSQGQREQVMKRFRKKTTQLLVATDVAARGIDVNDLNYVINYNLPDNLETYIHRSGRTGRAGKSGTSVSIIQPKERSKIFMLERKLSKKIDKRLVPTSEEICKSQLNRVVNKIENIEVDETKMEQYLTGIYERLEELDREEIIKRFISVEINRVFDDYKNAHDLNANVGRDRDRGSRRDRDDRDSRGFGRNRRDRDRGRDRNDRRRSRNSDIDFKRFFINVGAKKNLTPIELINLIGNATGKRNIEIGKIEILKNFSFFEVDGSFENDLINGFEGSSYAKVPLTVELTKNKKKRRKTSKY